MTSIRSLISADDETGGQLENAPAFEKFRKALRKWITRPEAKTVKYPFAGSKKGTERFIVLENKANDISACIRVNAGGQLVQQKFYYKCDFITVVWYDKRNNKAGGIRIIEDGVPESVQARVIDIPQEIRSHWNNGWCLTLNPFSDQLEGKVPSLPEVEEFLNVLDSDRFKLDIDLTNTALAYAKQSLGAIEVEIEDKTPTLPA